MSRLSTQREHAVELVTAVLPKLERATLETLLAHAVKYMTEGELNSLLASAELTMSDVEDLNWS